MQISKINNQNFGANPCRLTKHLLLDLERNSIDTSFIIRMIKDCYVGNSIATKRLSDGAIRVDMYHEGSHVRSLIPFEDNLHIDINNMKLKEPRSFARKLYDALNLAERERTADQRKIDKVYGAFSEK